ncbi:MAG: transcriptional regulator, partial [Lachnospiraceae bacterium]|nr:transcriptional regulator [Lachnospiraceae bacterium]
MSAAYDDVLKRLKEERNHLAWSQNEMSRYVRMSQSNYSKVELGLRRLNYRELEGLCESDVDIQYIYTAERSSAPYKNFFLKCDYSELRCYLGIIYSIAAFHYRSSFSEQWKQLYSRVKYVPLLEKNQGLGNIFLEVRRAEHCSQLQMAERLGVDVKKLRELENGRCWPDSELLCRIYEAFHIPPSVLLKNQKGMASEVAILVELMEKENEKTVFDIIKLIHKN